MTRPGSLKNLIRLFRCVSDCNDVRWNVRNFLMAGPKSTAGRGWGKKSKGERNIFECSCSTRSMIRFAEMFLESCFNRPFAQLQNWVNDLQWDVCKSPGFPSNRVSAGQVDPPAVRIAMVCSLFACCLSASEAFVSLSGAVCWVFSNGYTKEEHLLFLFRGQWSEKGRSYSTQKATRRLRHPAEALVKEAKL